jgi:hypothetical protein
MPTQEELIAANLSRQMALQLRALKDNLASQLIVEWLDLPGLNKSDIPAFLDVAVPLVEDAFNAAIAITEAINSTQGYVLLGDQFSDAPVASGGIIDQWRGGDISIAQVYQRPFVDYWMGLTNTGSLGESLASGENRIRQIVDSDIERIADFTQIEKFANEKRIVGYRRVLVGPVNCALCIVASTQRYHKRDLKPMHPHCDCRVSPVLSFESDGDHILDQDLLDQIHKSIADKFGTDFANKSASDYNKILVHHTHGEMGPQLTWRGQHFTGPSEIRL